VSVVELEVGRVAAYEVIGDGVPALLFPGGPGAAGSYMRKFAELSSSIFTNYLIDPHGSGGSTPPTSPDQYSPEGHARFYDEVRAALGLERVTVLGHSFGGGVALAYAALFRMRRAHVFAWPDSPSGPMLTPQKEARPPPRWKQCCRATGRQNGMRTPAQRGKRGPSVLLPRTAARRLTK